MIVSKVKNDQNNSFEPDLSMIDLSKFEVKGYKLNQDGETYTLELNWISNVPYMITQLQGKLLLNQMKILDQVEAMVEEAGLPTKIYWNTAQTWERTSPILIKLAPMIWPENTEKNLDNFFIEAKKLV